MDTYQLLRSALNVSAQRAELISTNIANVNTANYKAKRLEFESYLNDAMNGNRLALTTTNQKHLNPNDELQPKLTTNRNTSLKENGNNVDLEVEMLNQSTNSLYYNALTAQLNGRYHMLNQVLTNS